MEKLCFPHDISFGAVPKIAYYIKSYIFLIGFDDSYRVTRFQSINEHGYPLALLGVVIIREGPRKTSFPNQRF